MSTVTRNLSNIDGANVGNPDENMFAASNIPAYANDAAYEADFTAVAGSIYFNTTELLLREYNGTAWQNDKTSFTTQTDSTTTGSSQDITPNSFNQIIAFTHGSLASIRSVVPTIQKLMHIVNAQASQVITIKNEDATATAANRIVTGTGADFSLTPGQICTLIYETQGSRWRLAGGAASSGTGGRINLISHPNDATGWSETGTVFATPATTTASADLPLEGVIPTAIQFVATGSGSEATNYNSFPVTTSAVMNGKLQVDLFMRPGSGFAASEWTISVYQGSTRVSLEYDSSSISYLPNATTRYTTSVDVIASTAYTVRLARTSGTGVAVLNIVNVFFGWPDVSQVAPVGLWQTWTPSNTQGFGTISANELEYCEVGPSMFIRGRFTTGTVAASTAQLSLPNGLTVGGTTTSTVEVGKLSRDQSAISHGSVLATKGINYLTFGILNFGSAHDPLTAQLGNAIMSSTTSHSIVAGPIPIAEWAGAVSTAPVLAEEFAYNSSVTTATDTTSFAYGETGALIQAFVPGTTAFITKRVEFQYPKQSSEDVILEMNDGNGWVNATQLLAAFSSNDAGSTYYGNTVNQVSGSSTRFDVKFYSAAIPLVSWSALSTWRWRLRKTKKSAMPFKYVDAVTSGLARNYSSLAKIRLNTGNGHGSTNNKIRRFTNAVVNTGSGITYADSATLGATFTCTEAGVYSFEYTDCFSVASGFGLTLNSAQLTTAITSTTVGDRIALGSTAAASASSCVATTLALSVGDVVRPHTNGDTESGAPDRVLFTVQRVG